MANDFNWSQNSQMLLTLSPHPEDDDLSNVEQHEHLDESG